MKVIYRNNQFVCNSSFDERGIPKAANFLWDNFGKRWYTRDPYIAARLEQFCDDEAKIKIAEVRIKKEAWTWPITISRDETFFPFQFEATRFALERTRSYLALDPGLGKTPIAAVTASMLNARHPTAVLYICPPFLTRNTEAEFKRWASEIYTARFDSIGFEARGGGQCAVIPDSLISREEVQARLEVYKERARKNKYQILLIVDEAHRFKNPEAQRTRALFKKIAKGVDRILYLSGTPLVNGRPIELFPVLSHSARETIDNMDKFKFGERYCAAYRGPFGWDFSGASNVEELASKVLGTFMLRMRKKDVLKELPAKTEEIVIIGDELSPRLASIESKILQAYSPEDLIKGRIEARLGIEGGEGEDLHIATYRRELGNEKVYASIEYIDFVLESTDESVLIFAIHRETIATLVEKLKKYNPLIITGETPMGVRDQVVREFQTNKDRRIFIGNIQAAGVGITLTKATRVIFVEFSWVDGENSQAADRAHRIGQMENILVQYLIFKDSLDKTVLETVLKKRKVTEKL